MSPELGGGDDRGQKWNVGLGMRLTDAQALVSAGAVGCWGGGLLKGGLVAMAAGTAGAQSVGTWSSGHGRGLTKGERGMCDEEALPLPSGLYQEVSRKHWKMLEWNRTLGLLPTPGGHSSPGHMCCLRVPPVSQDVPWGFSSSVPLNPPHAAAAAACREARL